MTAPETPGQAAYEAFWSRESGFVVTPWGDAIPPSERDGWKAAAQAAIKASPELAKVRAELREITDNHAQLLEEILKNADEDTSGGDEAPEYLAEQYIRFLEGEVDRLKEPEPAPESVPWRQGRTQPRNIYARTGGDNWKADLMIGQLDTPAAAAEAVRAHNSALAPAEPQPAPELPCTVCDDESYEPGSVDIPSGERDVQEIAVVPATGLGTAWRLLDEARAKLAAVAELTAGMHAEADKIAPPGSEPDPEDTAAAQVLHEYASRIRQALGADVVREALEGQ